VEGALGAVRRLDAERRAVAQRLGQLLAGDAHERVTEAMDAAVALIARRRLVADGRGVLGAADVDLGRDARDEPVREAG
jgi:hypothetical protein